MLFMATTYGKNLLIIITVHQYPVSNHKTVIGFAGQIYVEKNGRFSLTIVLNFQIIGEVKKIQVQIVKGFPISLKQYVVFQMKRKT